MLAAGRGRRLRPLTDTLPKPLLPIGERALIEITLERLVEAGVSAIAINLHHLAERIRDRIGDSFKGVPITWSYEPQLLGTLGALTKLRPFLDAAELAVVINGDSLCEWPVTEVVAAHRGSDVVATLLFSERADPARFGGGVGVRGDTVQGFLQPAPGTPRVFAGLQVLAPAILDGLPVAPLDTVRDLYQPALESGSAFGAFLSDRPWFDLGTPARYLEAALANAPTQAAQGNVIAPNSQVATDADLSGCVVLDRATVASGARLRGVLVGPEAEVPCDTVYESAMLTRRHSGCELRSQDRIEGDLVVSPLGDA